MTAVNISIGHDYNFMVSDFIRVHSVIFRTTIANTCPNCCNQSAYFCRGQHFIKACPFNIQNLSP